MPGAERHTILNTIESVSQSHSGTFLRILNGSQTENYSYADVLSQAQSIAQTYRQKGIGHEDRIFIVASTSLDTVAAFIGAWLVGAVPSYLAPLTGKQSPDIYWRTLGEILATHKHGLLVVDAKMQAEIAGNQTLGLEPSRVLGLPINDQERPSFSPIDLPSHESSFIQFSSGTTGLRKGVLIRDDMTIAHLAAFQQTFTYEKSDCVVSWLPLYHDMGLVACLLMPLLTGTPIVLIDPIDWTLRPELLFSAIATYAGTRIFLPNFAFSHLTNCIDPDANFNLSSVKSIVNCSEPCRASSVDRFLERFGPCGIDPSSIHTSYAMAEAVFAVTYSSLDKKLKRKTFSEFGSSSLATGEERFLFSHDESILSCGTVMPGTKVMISDGVGAPQDDGVLGEVCLHGPSLFEAYETKDGKTPPPCFGPYFRTGDIGAVLDGELYVLGRSKEIIIVNGKNYFCTDLEAVTNEVEGIKPGRVVALSVMNEQTGTEECLMLVEKTGQRDDSALKRDIRKKLSDSIGLACRVEIIPPGLLVKTSSGKVSRSENLKQYLKR